jgi:hypothetical protein
MAFDLDCVAELAVQLAEFSALAGGKMGTLSPHYDTELAVQPTQFRWEIGEWRGGKNSGHITDTQ